MTRPPSLAGRAALAVLLMAGFYTLALAIAAVLAWLPVLEYQSLHRVHVKVALFCGIGALLILWSVLPRWDRFPAPGVRLDAARQPELFAAITQVAAATGQAMPKEVYLVPDVNAFVTQRGGIMGFFSRRVLGIGLPLLRVFSVDQVRAVLAHEFGHFHGGDTRLGPWIYKTRAAIGRTIVTLERAQSLVSLPFRAYFKVFLRVTEAISRAQEHAADRLAARVIGAEPVAQGLRQVPAAAALYGAYLDQEFAPVLDAGRRPPLAAGFQLFLRGQNVSDAAEQIRAHEMSRNAADPFDSHPPIPVRIAALEGMPPFASEQRDDRSALALLRELDALEQELIAFMTGKPELARLPAIGWSEVGTVLARLWTRQVGQWRLRPGRVLDGITAGGLPEQVARLAAIGKACGAADMPAEGHAAFGNFVLGATLGAALHARGFALEAEPGDPVVATLGEHRFEVLGVVQQLAEGKLAAAEWRERCARAGIGELVLVDAVAAG